MSARRQWISIDDMLQAVEERQSRGASPPRERRYPAGPDAAQLALTAARQRAAAARINPNIPAGRAGERH